MLRSMLVGLDGSPFSNAAVELGIAWAKRFDCQVTAVGVVDEPTIRGTEATPIGGGGLKREVDEQQLERSRHQVEQLLSGFALRCSEAGVSCKLLEEVGVPYQEIAREAQRYDLILMGRETYYRFDTQRTSEDTLEELLRVTPRPVVAVPDQLPSGNGLLIAFDGSAHAARGLQVFLASGLHTLDNVHIVTIDSNSSVEAAKTADRAVEFLGFHEIKAEPHAIASDERESKIILEKAHELGVELIVMGCNLQSRIHDIFLGSTTRRMLKEADLPLFLYS